MQTTANHEANANTYGYPRPIWALFLSAPRAGRFEPGTPGVVAGRAGTPAARSVLSLELRFDQGRVVDARFRAYGCPSSIAVGAWIAGWAQGREPAELATLTAARLRAELEIPQDRAHCALMGEDALRVLLAKFKA